MLFCPPEASPLEWMLLTNLPVNTFDEAVEKVSWYCLRWKIEILHKILKSGLKVEECRLETAERLMRYLTVMSVIAWRIFFITTIARTNPTLPCTTLLAEEEWKVLYAKIHKCPNVTPTIKEVVSWIAQLGGHLARKNDPEPGPITLWKGWRRLFDLSEGWRLATELYTYG
ncbi:Orf5 like phage WO protein [Wolbachia endosymbiont of Cylisticus convexus]|nr:Orf5 like phage WO protein [Wolbachia endosymbiont of Cylisticus convexus]